MTTTDELVRIDAGGWGLTWVADAVGTLRQVALGVGGAGGTLDFAAGLYPHAFPTWGGGDPYRPAALRVTHFDGTVSTRLVVDSVERSVFERASVDATFGEKADGTSATGAGSGVPGDERRSQGDGEHVIVTLSDELLDLRVELHCRTNPRSGILEQWVEVEHHQDGPVTLHSYDSLAPLLLATETAELHHFVGSGWADEWRWATQPVTPGTTDLASYGGLQPHLQMAPCLLVSPSGPTTETEGDVVGVSIAWGGNTHFGLDVRPRAEPGAPRELRLRAGANPVGADYVLDPGTRFVTPTVAWTWSGEGRGAVTRRFHRWTRDRVLRDPERIRPLVVNNWEATFFDFDEARIVDLIDRAADLGADVFLLDDGWFGTTHPRNDDTTSLGDWDHDPRKLPGGLAPLAEAAARAGIRFGIWLEPEMLNPVSDLHDEHPEWVLRDRREPHLHRHQLALDSLLSEVRDFEVDVVDRTLGQHAGISYVKWDANRPITDPGSSALGPDRQANVWVDHVRSTWAVMAEVAQRHPDVELMLCASGGGRTDHGTLRHFHEFWTSDNTDPVTRVRMQWSCGHFFPGSVMAAHVTRWGQRPMPFACAVALSGRFGFDLDLVGLSDDELATCRRAVAVARRTQDLVQQGDVERLVSPVEGVDRSRAAWAHISEDRLRAVLFAYQLEETDVAQEGAGSTVTEPTRTPPSRPLPTPPLQTPPPPTMRVVGLDPATDYRITSTDLVDAEDAGGGSGEDGSVMSGTDLATIGLIWPLDRPLTARIYEIDAI